MKKSRPHGLLFCYLIILFLLTLTPVRNQTAEQPNFVPFRDIVYRYGNAGTQILYNILLFLPFGFLFPEYFNRSCPKTVLAGGLLSLGIEILQLLFGIMKLSGRIFDITDLITNTAGALLGYLIFFTVQKTVRRG